MQIQLSNIFPVGAEFSDRLSFCMTLLKEKMYFSNIWSRNVGATFFCVTIYLQMAFCFISFKARLLKINDKLLPRLYFQVKVEAPSYTTSPCVLLTDLKHTEISSDYSIKRSIWLIFTGKKRSHNKFDFKLVTFQSLKPALNF